MRKKIALITGIFCQDAAYLAKFLLKKNYNIIGIKSKKSKTSDWRLKKLKIYNKINIKNIDVTDIKTLKKLFNNYNIDEIYNLAAQSSLQLAFKNPIDTSKVNCMGTLNLLEIIRYEKRKIKLYQASTSQIFGKKSNNKKLNYIFSTKNPYAISKIFAHQMVINYRESYNVFAVNGILFNHESPLRGKNFITRKITVGLSKIYQKKLNSITIGNMYSKRDWGYAEDYVEAIWKMMQLKKSKDFVISTGKNHSVKDFINTCLKILKMKTKWVGKGLNEKLINLENNKTIISIDKKYFRPTENETIQGNFYQAKKELKWKPKTNFNKLVKIMMLSDLNNTKNSDI